MMFVSFRNVRKPLAVLLVASVILAAGLRGITQGYELPEESAVNLFENSEAERRTDDAALLPTNLSAALDQMEGSELVREALGEHIFEWFLRNKRAEWGAYRTHVSSFELQRYLRTW